MKRFTVIVICTYVTFNTIAQEKQLNYNWNFGLGVTSSIVQTSEKTRKPAGLSMELGLAFGKHSQHQLAFDVSGVGKGKREKIGNAVWYTQEHSNTIYWSIPTGVISHYKRNTSTVYRQYNQLCSAFSYQYAMKIGEIFRLHLGPSIGSFYMDAYSEYDSSSSRNGRPELKESQKSASSLLYGFGTGISAREAGIGFIDLRYRYLKGKELELEVLNIKGSLHQITLIVGFCWNKQSRR